MIKKKKHYFLWVLFSLFLTQELHSENPISIVQSLDQAIQSMCMKGQFSGAVLVAIDGKIIFKKVCGLANRSFNVPNTIDTKFNLGSVGKLFTSVAIAQFIQQKKISLSTPLYHIIPNWLPDDPKSKRMTVGQLLIHASGFGNFNDDKRWQLGSDSALYVDVEDYKQLILDDHILYLPGTNKSYSNNGYLLLGAIIEAVTKENYFNYLKKNIFQPSGMLNTGIWRLDEIIPNRAEGYFEVCEKGKCFWRNNNYEAPFIGSPAGGAYSTIGDLFRFSQSLHNGTFLNPELTKDLLSIDVVKVSEDIKEKEYQIDDLQLSGKFSPHGFAGAWNSFGIAVWEKPFLVGHTGGIQGASAFFATTPDNKYTIIILSNISGSAPIKLYKKIREILGFSGEITNY